MEVQRCRVCDCAEVQRFSSSAEVEQRRCRGAVAAAGCRLQSRCRDADVLSRCRCRGGRLCKAGAEQVQK